jgi:hypothetical protein
MPDGVFQDRQVGAPRHVEHRTRPLDNRMAQLARHRVVPCLVLAGVHAEVEFAFRAAHVMHSPVVVIFQVREGLQDIRGNLRCCHFFDAVFNQCHWFILSACKHENRPLPAIFNYLLVLPQDHYDSSPSAIQNQVEKRKLALLTYEC